MSLLFLQGFIFILVYVCLYICSQACRRPWTPEESIRAGAEQWQAVVSHPVWVVGPELSPPQEQQACLASSSPAGPHASS